MKFPIRERIIEENGIKITTHLCIDNAFEHFVECGQHGDRSKVCFVKHAFLATRLNAAQIKEAHNGSQHFSSS